jgi:hypothetical protein
MSYQFPILILIDKKLFIFQQYLYEIILIILNCLQIYQQIAIIQFITMLMAYGYYCNTITSRQLISCLISSFVWPYFWYRLFIEARDRSSI